MKQAHVYISGFVHGVGFRAYVSSKAKKLGVAGWVRNLSDGRVEAVLQGEKEKIKKVIKYCSYGPFFANVTNVVVDWEEAKEEYTGFVKKETF
jgi:acylphosphatase